MSIKKDILNTLKKLVGVYEEEFSQEQPAEETPAQEQPGVEENFKKVYSETEVKISQREVGGKVEIIGSEGELTPAEDGEYEMGDGFIFTVKDGVVSAIDGEEAPTEEERPAVEEEATSQEGPVVEEQPTEEPNADMDAMKAKVAELESTVAALAQVVEELKGSAATKQDMEGFKTQVSTLDANIQKLAKVPVEFSRTTNNNTVRESKEETLLELAKMLGRK